MLSVLPNLEIKKIFGEGEHKNSVNNLSHGHYIIKHLCSQTVIRIQVLR